MTKICFGVKCSCGKGCLVEVTREQAQTIQADVVAGLYVISTPERDKILDFWVEHEQHGHELEPTLCEIVPMNKGTN